MIEAIKQVTKELFCGHEHAELIRWDITQRTPEPIVEAEYKCLKCGKVMKLRMREFNVYDYQKTKTGGEEEC